MSTSSTRPEANAALNELRAVTDGKPNTTSLGNHWARMIEVLHCIEMIRELLNDPDLQGTDLVAKGERREEGIGVIEAPRGNLIHHYKVDEHDQVTYCNLIVSTTHNNEGMNRAVKDVAMKHLSGHEQITEGMLNHIEVAIRAYDPCLSCATHALGQMPLAVEIQDADGNVIDKRETGGGLFHGRTAHRLRQPGPRRRRPRSALCRADRTGGTRRASRSTSTIS